MRISFPYFLRKSRCSEGAQSSGFYVSDNMAVEGGT